MGVGSIGFGSEGDIERVTAEIGYWLGESYWGRGIMPRVVAAVTRYAFETFGYQKLYALVFDYNPGSMRVLEKAGYQLEAVLHKAAVKNGKVIDFYYYSILKEN
ncbi:GNAT family N-acetyltransferase [Butyricimonas virosa]|uniref:GNAT family N-acetyltransferase n=1 Tax=Butyricimonas virosa TaxID=544645 RepID=UPI002432356E|nr:GNAT family protein [Butyricimonas virosa]